MTEEMDTAVKALSDFINTHAWNDADRQWLHDRLSYLEEMTRRYLQQNKEG